MLFKLSDLQNMDIQELRKHDNDIWEYWKTIRKVVEFRELTDNTHRIDCWCNTCKEDKSE